MEGGGADCGGHFVLRKKTLIISSPGLLLSRSPHQIKSQHIGELDRLAQRDDRRTRKNRLIFAFIH